MTVSSVYSRLANIALSEFSDVVVDARVLRLPTGDPLKLRLEIVDRSNLDVWLSASGRYSYHWERRHTPKGGFYRYDNAPHQRWRHISTFPHHFHQGEVVTESNLAPYPAHALRQVLDFVRATLLSERAGQS